MTSQEKLGSDEMFCSSCGSVIKKRAEICVHCGVKVGDGLAESGQSVEYSEKSRTVAGILGIVLGGIGVHRFYLGNVGLGILQIVVTVFTLGIGGLWGFIEGVIIIAGGKWKDGDGKPLRPHGQ